MWSGYWKERKASKCEAVNEILFRRNHPQMQIWKYDANANVMPSRLA
jgi:hypothetical protein